MPTYTYECPSCQRSWDEVWTIAEMEARERQGSACEHCQGIVRRVLAFNRPVIFKEGFHEHISENGAYITNMSDLKRIAKENGNYSIYAEDLGGLFRGKEGRWV